MTITSVSRWKGTSDKRELVRELGLLLKSHGAELVRTGACHAGAHAGQAFTFVTFPDWATYGQAMQDVTADFSYAQIIADLSKNSELLERYIVNDEEL